MPEAWFSPSALCVQNSCALLLNSLSSYLLDEEKLRPDSCSSAFPPKLPAFPLKCPAATDTTLSIFPWVSHLFKAHPSSCAINPIFFVTSGNLLHEFYTIFVFNLFLFVRVSLSAFFSLDSLIFFLAPQLLSPSLTQIIQKIFYLIGPIYFPLISLQPTIISLSHKMAIAKVINILFPKLSGHL